MPPGTAPEHYHDSRGEFVIYRTEDNRTEVHLRVIEGSVWMTQAEIADLFGVSIKTISEHLKGIYSDNELSMDRTIRKIRRVRSEGDRDVTRTMNHYNLDAILAVGYRVRGPRGNQFRTWATEVLTEYLIKGFAMNDEKLKDPRGLDYFDELLARIRDIRSSEKRLYQKLRDILALCDDYDKDSPRATRFFQTIQNKLHYAITGQTASEIIATRCEPTADNLGLTTWSGNQVRKKDIATAKNYLTHEELEELNRLVSQFLDFAESQAKRRIVTHMDQWLDKADQFIEFNAYQALTDSGRITMQQAKALAEERYAIYDAQRRAPEENRLAEEDLLRLQEIERQILADRRRLSPRRKH